MNDLKERIKNLQNRLEGAFDLLGLENERGRLEKLEQLQSDQSFWEDRAKATEVTKESASIKTHLDKWDNITDEINSLAEIIFSLTEKEKDLLKEAEEKIQKLEQEFTVLEFELLFSDSYDQNDCLLSISAGSGGTDAQDWAEILFRMYTRYCQKEGWDVSIIESSEGEEAGIKSVTIEIKGHFCYGYLKSEHGVHRLVRISPFDSDKARHTSFALVETLPVIDQDEVEIKDDDLKIDVFRSSGHGGQSVNTTDSAVRITHLPTGITAVSQNERSQLQNKESALKVVRAKIAILAKKEHNKQMDKFKEKNLSAEWGNQIRSYVLHPYTKVKDNRSGFETADVQAVLNGDLDKLIESYLRKKN